MEPTVPLTPLVLEQILPPTLGRITRLVMVRPVTLQKLQALTAHLATARARALGGCTRSRTVGMRQRLLGRRFLGTLLHR